MSLCVCTSREREREKERVSSPHAFPPMFFFSGWRNGRQRRLVDSPRLLALLLPRGDPGAAQVWGVGI